jgi:glutamyl-tRNA synthetase
MSIRLRFAPSPTGHLHIGGARTALYNFFLARSLGGKIILRIEDTDQERSSKDFEQSQIVDMKWLGIDYDEGPDELGGDYGPYRQSERGDIYAQYTNILLDKGLAYYDFCTEEELEAMKKEAEAKGEAPFYTGKWRQEQYFDEAKKRIANGESAAIRFKVNQKPYTLKDRARGKVEFPADMVGDFVLVRSSGVPVYNFCCVIDDYLMKISHVIRGEDHLNNTLRQLMLYEALGFELPEFIHVSLLIGKDRQKLSKRHGATSLHTYREQSYLPQAINNYLSLLGWSHPEEKDIIDLQEFCTSFTADRFNKSPAVYDTEKLAWVNEQHVKLLSEEQRFQYFNQFMPKDHRFHSMLKEWQEETIDLLKDQVQLGNELAEKIDSFIFDSEILVNEETRDILNWESTSEVLSFLIEKINAIDHEFLSVEQVGDWMNVLKKEKGIKGKALFMGLRYCLTGKNFGPDLKRIVSLTPVEICRHRLQSIQGLK